MRSGGGLVVSMFAINSDNPSSNPTEVYIFFCKMLLKKNENSQKKGQYFDKQKNGLTESE